MHHLAYVSPSMMTVLPPHAPIYQYRRPPDLVPTSSYIFLPSVSAPTSPIYPTPPSPSSPNFATFCQWSFRQSTPFHNLCYARCLYAYGIYNAPLVCLPFSGICACTIYPWVSRPPSSLVPALRLPTGQESQGTWWYSPPGSTVAFNSFDGTQREFQPRATAGYPPLGQLDGEPPDQPNTASLPSETQHTRRQQSDTHWQTFKRREARGRAAGVFSNVPHKCT
jgi:hypothetical protein